MSFSNSPMFNPVKKHLSTTATQKHNNTETQKPLKTTALPNLLSLRGLTVEHPAVGSAPADNADGTEGKRDSGYRRVAGSIPAAGIFYLFFMHFLIRTFIKTSSLLILQKGQLLFYDAKWQE